MKKSWIRSMLFVPGHKRDWIIKACRYGADALILDLEDSVPAELKDYAREQVCSAVKEIATTAGPDTPALFVRVNGWETGELLADVTAVASEVSLQGLVLAKVRGPGDVQALSLVLDNIDHQRDRDSDRLEIVPMPETVTAVRDIEAVCRASTRVHRLTGISGLTPGSAGDLQSDIGVEPSGDGMEMLYADSRCVLGARAAGLAQILGGQSSRLDDPDIQRRSWRRAKMLGASGSTAIHPSQIEIIHDVFTPSAAEVESASRMLKAFDAAVADGNAAIRYNGEMIDYAQVQRLRGLIERAKSYGVGTVASD